MPYRYYLSKFETWNLTKFVPQTNFVTSYVKLQKMIEFLPV